MSLIRCDGRISIGSAVAWTERQHGTAYADRVITHRGTIRQFPSPPAHG